MLFTFMEVFQPNREIGNQPNREKRFGPQKHEEKNEYVYKE